MCNKLTPNFGKIYFIIFHRKKLPIEIDPVLLGDWVVERMQHTKFLSVTVEENLKWD